MSCVLLLIEVKRSQAVAIITELPCEEQINGSNQFTAVAYRKGGGGVKPPPPPPPAERGLV
jgi:hypothetical protein